MLAARTCTSSAVCAQRPVPAAAASARPLRAVVTVRASSQQQQPEQQQALRTSRRDASLGALALVAGLAANAAPARAILGIGEEDKTSEVYYAVTKKTLDQVQKVLDLPKDAPEKEDEVKELRKELNNWVAAYRREGKVAGKPSFGVTYSVLNALAGHFNSFGPTAPLPKKRLERINKEMKDAQLYISRGR